MEIKYFDAIPFHLDLMAVGEILKVHTRESMMEVLEEQIQIAKEAAVPKAAYFEAVIEKKDSESVTFCGETFNSKMLSEAVRVDQSVYPYIITIGTEMEKRYQELDDIMEQYLLDGVQGVILGQATEFVSAKIKELHGLKEVAYHIPGELNDWDLKEQPRLFQLFGDTQKKLGVALSQSNLMQPSKSVSGVYYGKE